MNLPVHKSVRCKDKFMCKDKKLQIFYEQFLILLWLQRLAGMEGYSFQQMERGNSSVNECHERKQHSCQPSRADARSCRNQAGSTLNDFCRQAHSSRQYCSCFYLLSTHYAPWGICLKSLWCSFDFFKMFSPWNLCILCHADKILTCCLLCTLILRSKLHLSITCRGHEFKLWQIRTCCLPKVDSFTIWINGFVLNECVLI